MLALHKQGRLLLILLLFGLSGCASLQEELKSLKLPEFKGPAFGFNTYASAKQDFDRGHIMEARARVLAMDKSRKDYPQAKELLDKQIEPARLRLLRHYSSLAANAENGGDWSKAMDLYDQAITFSTDPKSLRDSRNNMELKMRQARMDRLIDRRRKLDAAWLAAADNLEAPKGVDPKDDVVARERDQFVSALEDRAANAYYEAGRYLRKGAPEIAYVEIESHLRLQPDSERGKDLMAQIKAALPKGIVIPAQNVSPLQKLAESPKPVMPKSVTREQIQKFMDKGDWVSAKRYAQVYRREGGANASQLLKQIQEELEAKAAEHNARARLEFRRERLDAAVTEWSKAVELVPENLEYVDSLRRAQQLQERLKLLQDGGGQPDASTTPAPAPQ
ncbi:MAG TPA: 4-hydroxy-3-methylbut-2-en-1-yl diphosphate synthase [Mariprofundaceae bacterium]|nr:4-hydroxy-3-methylbut-2-en-1-yl diphosphate synthase [Mariprofundaceae bacterium]